MITNIDYRYITCLYTHKSLFQILSQNWPYSLPFLEHGQRAASHHGAVSLLPLPPDLSLCWTYGPTNLSKSTPFCSLWGTSSHKLQWCCENRDVVKKAKVLATIYNVCEKPLIEPHRISTLALAGEGGGLKPAQHLNLFCQEVRNWPGFRM